jgi:hypothetical protein
MLRLHQDRINGIANEVCRKPLIAARVGKRLRNKKAAAEATAHRSIAKRVTASISDLSYAGSTRVSIP